MGILNKKDFIHLHFTLRFPNLILKLQKERNAKKALKSSFNKKLLQKNKERGDDEERLQNDYFTVMVFGLFTVAILKIHNHQDKQTILEKQDYFIEESFEAIDLNRSRTKLSKSKEPSIPYFDKMLEPYYRSWFYLDF